MGYYKPRPKNPPSKHDHTYFMVYNDGDCYCSDCGQRWIMKRIYDDYGKVMTSKSGWKHIVEKAESWD
jgi:hypothetical protein